MKYVYFENESVYGIRGPNDGAKRLPLSEMEERSVLSPPVSKQFSFYRYRKINIIKKGQFHRRVLVAETSLTKNC